MKKIIISVVLLAVIGGGIWLAKGSPSAPAGAQEAKYADPVDATEAFYSKWLKSAQDPTAIPDRTTLAKSSALTNDLSDQISTALKGSATLDPVLCQSVVPQAISFRSVFALADQAQVLVTSKDKKVSKQATVTLNKSNDSWVLNKIECTDGEVAPAEKEFSFEQEGALLKQSIPKPYSTKNWHLVFTDDGVPGNVVPLFFNTKSQCTALDGTTAVCKPDKFVEATKVMVHGQMTDTGATVVRLELVK